MLRSGLTGTPVSGYIQASRDKAELNGVLAVQGLDRKHVQIIVCVISSHNGIERLVLGKEKIVL